MPRFKNGILIMASKQQHCIAPSTISPKNSSSGLLIKPQNIDIMEKKIQTKPYSQKRLTCWGIVHTES